MPKLLGMYAVYEQDTVVLVRAGGRDDYGEPPLRARIVWGEKVVRSAAGEEVVSAANYAGLVMRERLDPATARVRIEGLDHDILAVR